MLEILRCTAENPDFKELVHLLDAELAERDGDDHAFYAQFNHVVTIKHVLVAYRDKQPVGCGAIKDYETGVMEVKRMYVRRECRGEGIAGKVLSGLEAWAQELGKHKCVLETGMNQPEAIRLYQKSGYQRIPNYGQYAAVDNSVCFEKML